MFQIGLGISLLIISFFLLLQLSVLAVISKNISQILELKKEKNLNE